MKENVKERLNGSKADLRDLLLEVARQLLGAVFGFLTARGVLFGKIAPFGLAYIAAIPADYIAVSAFGCFWGYLITPLQSNFFRYLAALCAIVAVKAILSAFTKYAGRAFISSATSGIVTCATGVVAVVGDSEAVVYILCEAVLAFAATYFIVKTVKAAPSFRTGLQGEELACFIISVNLLLLGAMSFKIGEISVGKILCITLILLSSRYGRTAAGAVCGTVAGFMAAVSGSGASCAAALSIAGLTSGIFASWGKYAQVAVTILSSLVGSLVGSDITETVELLIVSLFGSALFLLIPKSAVAGIGKVFSPPTKTVSDTSMKKAVTMRLNFAAGALSDVSQTVETVASELSRINSPTFDGVLKGIEKDACAGCSLCVNCWEARKSDTVSAILEMIKAVRNGDSGEITPPDEFRGRCLRPARVSDAVTVHYGDYASRMAAESRISDVRSVVSEQFNGISNMLYDMAAELERDEAFDDRTANKISQSLKNINIPVNECSCRIDKFGRMTVEIIAATLTDVTYNKIKLLRQAEICCERDFEPPVITESGGKTYITLTERAAFTVDTGVCQIACSPSGISGDAYNTFCDGKGRCFVILSDGMGCGGRAAVDGAMASGLLARLLKAGFGYDSALSILNSAMLFKSTDESLATVDIACIDLFSGRTDMLKAGAAPTVVRRGGKCGVAQSTSLPVGILREIGFDKATVKLKSGDLLLLMSDGVNTEGTDWICAELEGFKGGSAAALAEQIAYSARRRRSDNHSDDITVIAAIVEKAV